LIDELIGIIKVDQLNKISNLIFKLHPGFLQRQQENTASNTSNPKIHVLPKTLLQLVVVGRCGLMLIEETGGDRLQKDSLLLLVRLGGPLCHFIQLRNRAERQVILAEFER